MNIGHSGRWMELWNYLIEAENESKKVYRTFIPELDDEQMDERLENHTYCPNGDSESGGAPIFTISITLFQIGYFIYMYKWQYEKPVTSKIY